MKIIAKNFEGVNELEQIKELESLLELIENDNKWYEVVDGEQVINLINQNNHAEKRFDILVRGFTEDVKTFCSQHNEWVLTWLKDRIKTEKMWYYMLNGNAEEASNYFK